VQPLVPLAYLLPENIQETTVSTAPTGRDCIARARSSRLRRMHCTNATLWRHCSLPAELVLVLRACFRVIWRATLCRGRVRVSIDSGRAPSRPLAPPSTATTVCGTPNHPQTCPQKAHNLRHKGLCHEVLSHPALRTEFHSVELNSIRLHIVGFKSGSHTAVTVRRLVQALAGAALGRSFNHFPADKYSFQCTNTVAGC